METPMGSARSVDPSPGTERFDAIVIGTGFGGAVVACRLAQAEKRICVLERGRRYESQSPQEYRTRQRTPGKPEPEPEWSDFPRLPSQESVLPDPRRWAWMNDHGLWDVRDLGDIFTVQAAGYGGGSLVYANVHLRAPEEIFEKWPFTRQDLDPYYDLAAYMFDLKPITEAPFYRELEKTEQLDRVAQALGRGDDFFYPPLAINFDDQKSSPRAQSACNGCAECCTGCRYRAKNTLDLNYLAIVDDSPNAEVRTQAEARHIRAEETGYSVVYRDHLRGGEEREIFADWVFVCAGAVGSTELLLRSKAKGDKGLPALNKEHLGHRYFPNADAIGMVYDARTPTGSPRQLGPTRGPTITAFIHHQEETPGSAKPRWFLLEEGGIPVELARHIGMLRSPALLRRNRHEDRAGSAAIGPVAPFDSPAGLAQIGGVAAASPADSRETGNEAEPLRSLPAAAYRLLRDQPDVLWGALPEQFREALQRLERELDPFLQSQVESFVPKVREELLSHFLYPCAKWIFWLMRLFGKDPDKDITKATRKALLREYGIGVGADWNVRFKTASEIVQWLAKFDDAEGCHSQNLMVLLAMGPDRKPGEFKLNKQEELELTLPEFNPIYTRQECLMRDVACALGGKLRVNPLWAYARTPITVHSQGGCPMSSKAEDRVTDPWGEVHGHRGLFVMDAAAFPGPVGVNPAATITAVAERNMAHLLGKPSDMVAAEEWKRQQEWMQHPRVRLEPPLDGPTKPLETAPVGIKWHEKMTGFHDASAPPGEDDAVYEAAESTGREKGKVVSIDLIATVGDVARVIESREHVVRMEGSATVNWNGRPDPAREFKVEGTLKLPDHRTPVPPAGRKMLLELRSAAGDLKLTGYKRMRNDPGPDAWRDTSTLFLTLERPHSGETSYGVIRLSLDEFLFEQMKSFRVTNTQDPARIVWALTSFVAYFFAALQGVYVPVPRLSKLIEAFTNLDAR